MAGTVEWTEEIYDWSPAKIYEYTHQQNKTGIVYIEYSYLQIGLTREWFRNISNQINDPLVVRREILLQRLRGSSLSPYDREDIETIIDMCKKPIGHIMLNEYYKMNLYSKLNRAIPYIVGVDCSTGNDNDNNAISVVDPYTLELCAEFECSYVGEPEFEACIFELVKKHIPRAIVCIERNSVGDSTIAHLLNTAIAGRIYYDKFEKLAEDNMKDLQTIEDMLKAKARKKSYYGVFTEGKSRDAMFSILANHIKNYKDKFIGQNVTRDISKLIRKASGKIEAGPGFHDDSVMSYLISLYVYYHGNNLEIFGFNHGDEFDLSDKNAGLVRPEEVDISGLSDEVAEFVEAAKKRNSKTSFYDQMFNDMLQSQQKTQRLVKAGMIEDPYNQKMHGSVYVEDEDSYDLSFFDEINGC